MEFCPRCGLLLQFKLPCYDSKNARLFCPVCPYAAALEARVRIKKKERLEKKEKEQIYSEDHLALKPITAETCPKCGHDKAGFTQAQTRSADEPMTTWYTCADDACRHTWIEN